MALIFAVEACARYPRGVDAGRHQSVPGRWIRPSGVTGFLQSRDGGKYRGAFVVQHRKQPDLASVHQGSDGYATGRIMASTCASGKILCGLSAAPL